jgi:HipA-like protein
MKLTYVPGAATLGVPLISVSMPMSSAAYTDKVVRPFFHGLLPEGDRPVVETDTREFLDDDVIEQRIRGLATHPRRPPHTS